MVKCRDSPYESQDKCGVGKYSDLVGTLRSLKEKIRIFKVDNDRIVKEQEKQAEVNAIIL